MIPEKFKSWWFPRMTWSEMKRRWPTLEAYEADHTQFENITLRVASGLVFVAVPVCSILALLGAGSWRYVLAVIAVAASLFIMGIASMVWHKIRGEDAESRAADRAVREHLERQRRSSQS